MTSHVRHVTVDCSDPYTLGTFWAEVLGGALADEDRPGDPEVVLEHAGTPMLFIKVDDARVVKNRVHLDLQPQDRTRDEEVDRLLALGASIEADHRRAEGLGWVTMVDVEGNEFCVERSKDERGSA
jgi:predicted enzyme related to lactoylglutathione lyase